MSGWVRDPRRRRLVRVEPELKSKKNFEHELKMKQERYLNDIFYPLRTSFHSCFNLSDPGPNVTFEFRPHYTQMFPKFTSLKDVYFVFE